MCGLAGYMDLLGQRQADPSVVEKMCSVLQHRGPDSSGAYINKGIGLGFRRLKIMDPKHGDQPLYSSDGSIVLLCNGEIYNYKELRHSLRNRDIKFKTESDVEVLIYLYQEKGIDFVKLLNGQFAFVIYDSLKNKLYLARDHFGICPLFYTISNNWLIFGSEIKSILQHPEASRLVDMVGLDQIITFPGLISPRTLFKDIHSLESGQFAQVEKCELSLHHYWQLDYPTHRDGFESDQYYTEQLEHLLTKSVNYRLQADVPVATYLSGGLDSSLINSYVSELYSNQAPAFSITFAEAAQDESSYQDIVAQHLDLEQIKVPFEFSHSYEEFRKMIWHSEAALKETYNLCSMQLSKTIKSHDISVVLSGEGADELFGGYAGYRLHSDRPDNNINDELQLAYEQQYRKKLWGNQDYFYERQYHAFNDIKQALYSDSVSSIYDQINCVNHKLIDTEYLRGRSDMDIRSFLDFKLRLSDHLVSDHGDRMGMANSVEIRYPFLDKELVEFSTRLPEHLKVNNGIEKVVLKTIAQQRLPHQISNRQKFGFHAAGTDSFLKHDIEWINDMLSYEQIKRQGYFNPDSVEYLKKQYSQPDFKLRLPYDDDFLMVILSFGIFLDVFSMPNT